MSKFQNFLQNSCSTLFTFGFTFLIAALLNMFVFQVVAVSGRSMMPTLNDGQYVFIEKVSNVFSEPDREDIVVFPVGDCYFIKRVIGLPGETVRIDEQGNIFINDVLYEEENAFDTIVNPELAADGIEIGDDEVFVLGDNRNNSSDSRFADVGNVKLDNIVGTVLFH